MMKKNAILFCLVFCGFLLMNCRSGLVTTSNSCYNTIKSGNADNDAGNYSAAIDKFGQVLKQCDAYDAKEQANAGLAAAYNGLRQYNDALNAANAGLKISSTSVNNLFQRAHAELGLQMNAEAKADFAKIIDLTQKNQNVKDRATIYAKMAEIDLQMNMYDDAMNNVGTAITTDNSNPDFYILKGDIYSAQGNYSDAMAAYDQAVTVGGNSERSWQAKVEAEIKAMQKKYATGSNAADLAGKLSVSDKTVLCSDIQKAKTAGVNSANIDLLQLSVCK